jgi:hypothetical protein
VQAGRNEAHLCVPMQKFHGCRANFKQRFPQTAQLLWAYHGIAVATRLVHSVEHAGQARRVVARNPKGPGGKDGGATHLIRRLAQQHLQPQMGCAKHSGHAARAHHDQIVRRTGL